MENLSNPFIFFFATKVKSAFVSYLFNASFVRPLCVLLIAMHVIVPINSVIILYFIVSIDTMVNIKYVIVQI